MRNTLTVAALVVFAVSSGLLEMVRAHDRPIIGLPAAMATFDAVPDASAVTAAMR